MEDNELSSASKPGVPRTLQACQRCRTLKTRCLPGPQPGICQRCSTGAKECIWADQPRRARKLRAPSRISQVEQKIDGLVAKLVSPPQTQPAAASSTPTSTLAAHSETSSSTTVGPWPETWKSNRTVGPGSWLPFPKSFEEETSLPERGPPPASVTPTVQGDGETDVDLQYIEQIRDIHNFGDTEDLHQAPRSLFQPSRQREPPIDHDLVKQLFSAHEADSLLNGYRQMSASYPFVIVPSNMTAEGLHHERPMLLLAILTVASSKEHKRQMSLDTIFRQELAQRTIIRPRRTLGLVQSVLVYLSWYHFVFSHKTQQIFFLHHLVIGLALDIGLHRDYQPLHFPHQPKPTPPSPHEQRERERAFLGCYYLSSMIGAGLQKPNLLKHASYMTEWALNLKQQREYDFDETICHLITLRQLDDQVQDTLYSGSAVDLPLSDGRTLMHVRFLETLLETWKRESQGAGAQRLLNLSSSFTEMLLHGVALRKSTTEGPFMTVDSTQLNALMATLEAGKKFMDALLSFQADEYHLISFSEWMRLPAAIMTVARLCIPSDAHTAVGWDVKTAQERVRLDLCLEALCYRMQQLSTYDKVTQPHPDFWWAMRIINELTKNWYLRKIKPPPSSQPTPSGATGPTGSDRSGPSAAALPTPSADQCPSTFGMGADAMSGMNMGAMGDVDPFTFMRDVDFDMEQFLDMGIWGDETYNGMGFGGGMSF